MSRPLFKLGQLLSTPDAIAAFDEAGESQAAYLANHVTGDWGVVDPEDWQTNDQAVTHGDRILSAYILPKTNKRVWIITEADRSVTTILLPENY